MRYTVPLGGHAEGSYRVRDINPLQFLAGHKSAASDPLHTLGNVYLLQTETAGESVAGGGISRETEDGHLVLCHSAIIVPAHNATEVKAPEHRRALPRIIFSHICWGFYVTHVYAVLMLLTEDTVHIIISSLYSTLPLCASVRFSCILYYKFFIIR